MTSVADFIKLQKKDFHSNLDLGMRYSSYVTWSGFYMPDFPEDGSPASREIAEQVKEYTMLRTGNTNDVQKLMALSLTENEADNIIELNGSVNITLLNACDTPEDFVNAITAATVKYSSSIKINPILAINTDEMTQDTTALASSLLGSQLFKGVYLYGQTLFNMPQKFTAFITSAKDHNLKTEINAGLAKSSDDFMKLLRTFVPDVMIQGECAAKDREILNFMNKNKITAVITPNPFTSGTENTIEKKAQYLRNFLDAGTDAKLGTESILLYNKSISQMASELCNTGLFTKEEITSILV